MVNHSTAEIAKYFYSGIFNNLPNEIIEFGLLHYANKHYLNKFFKFLDLYFEEPENKKKLENTTELNKLVEEKMRQWVKIMDFNTST